MKLSAQQKVVVEFTANHLLISDLSYYRLLRGKLKRDGHLASGINAVESKVAK